MNTLERRLIELQEALLKLNSGQAPDEELLSQARRSLAGTFVDTGSGNDTVVINKTVNNNDCATLPSRETGYTGSQGAVGYTGSGGFTGSQGGIGFTGSVGIWECEAKVVDSDYVVQNNDYYVGVNSDGPVTITLPCSLEECREIIIKAEMGPPLGNRKVTIVTDSDCKIDDDDEYVITVPYQSIRLLSRGGAWRIV